MDEAKRKSIPVSLSGNYFAESVYRRERVIELPTLFHQDKAPAETLTAGGLELTLATNRVYAYGVLIELGPTEFRMLHFFMSHMERVYSRAQLLDQVWEKKVVVEERTVDVHVRHLRAVLEPAGLGCLIQTVRGRGYRFSLEA